MKTVGIIAEFNPFTNGHVYFLKTIRQYVQQKYREDCRIIAVMSGSFVQRGEPAFANKFLRGETAIEGGADLVLELPTAWSLRSAEHFARGGIALLQGTGLIDLLACGTEHTDFDFVSCSEKIARAQQEIKAGINSGKSYGAALKEAVPDLPESPNDILTLEYIKQAPEFSWLLIPRIGAYHGQELNQFASASAVRRHWPKVIRAVPESTLAILLNHAGYNIELYWRLIQYRLRMLSPREIAACTTVSEGLENLLKKAQNAVSYADALQKCSTKRYPLSRIRRLFAQLTLCQPREAWEQDKPTYLRVLAFNAQGRALLKAMKNSARLPVIIKPHDLYDTDIAATDLLASLQNEPAGLDYTYPLKPKE